LSSTGESSESSRTLPRAELNPLLNPLLASHMGRWAEVYFTSPPEKREEAILELLRELEESAGNVSAPPVPEHEAPEATQYFSPVHGNGESAASVEQHLVSCQRCGHDNPMTHQFCGMCGSSLTAATGGESKADSPYGQHEGEMESNESTLPFQPASQAAPESYVDESRPPEDESQPDPYDLSMLQGLREREIDDYEYEERSSTPYRYYIGGVLAILLLLLGYLSWRSGRMSQGSHQASAPPAAAPANRAPAQASPPQTISAAPSSPLKVSQHAASLANANVAQTSTPQAPASASLRAAGSDQNSALAATSSTSAATEPQLTSSSGTEELAMAQRYLSGGNGQERDTTEAVKWLWKAMAKHNGPAALQLADLYLKGDGVSKNCDQARVLLDSAARRGMAAAGERLRNLQAFGCP